MLSLGYDAKHSHNHPADGPSKCDPNDQSESPFCDKYRLCHSKG
jgi:hypothetical protein